MARTRKKKSDQPMTTAQQLGSLIKSARDIMRKDKGLLDLRQPYSMEDFGDDTYPLIAIGMNWSRAHMVPDDPDSEWKPQYFLPRYIADCARQAGFKGIIFESPRHFGSNLVLFEWDNDQVHAKGDPAIYRMEGDPRDPLIGQVDF